MKLSLVNKLLDLPSLEVVLIFNHGGFQFFKFLFPVCLLFWR
jgi:hypothetical protein